MSAGPTALESVLGRERFAWLAGPALAVALCWAWLIPAALDMYGAMDGLSAWMMDASWDAAYAAMIFAMWTAMMVAMMLPSAAPALLIYGRVARSDPAGKVALRVHAFALGYVLAWTAFSALATILQWQLGRMAVLTPMMELHAPQAGGALLILAGAWQWTPQKLACLVRCRSPVSFISSRWRRGAGGALRMGFEHGLWCLGCCWAAMLLLFAGGVMSLAWIVGLSAFVLLEKVLPYGEWVGRAAGVLAIAGGLVLVLR